MCEDNLEKILKNLKDGSITVEEAQAILKKLPFSDLSFAKIDNHRALRKGFPEVIFCQGKTTEQIRHIASELLEHSNSLLATRANYDAFEAIKEIDGNAIYYENAKIVVVDRRVERTQIGNVVILSAGTADIPVAEEAAITAELLNANVNRIYDVGVAGLHRLFAFYDQIEEANVVIVVAGMDGVLPSVVGGLFSRPVIAVPTSVGYGAHFGGLAPLLTMLNSCAPGVTVVNIDNGFGAGYVAAMINRSIEEK